jgi:hypothetical protein
MRMHNEEWRQKLDWPEQHVQSKPLRFEISTENRVEAREHRGVSGL